MSAVDSAISGVGGFVGIGIGATAAFTTLALTNRMLQKASDMAVPPRNAPAPAPQQRRIPQHRVAQPHQITPHRTRVVRVAAPSIRPVNVRRGRRTQQVPRVNPIRWY